jgi:hypothetical protein
MATSPDMAWISGLSAGNNLEYYLMNHTVSGVDPIPPSNWNYWIGRRG